MNYPESILVPFRDKAFPCRLTHRVVMKAERDLGLNILYAKRPLLVEQPLAYQMACWLYVLLSSTEIKNLTLDECIDASLGECKEEYAELLGAFIDQLCPMLLEVNGLKPDNPEVEEAPAPLPVSSGGESDGQPPV
jgi:hypothetical protein